MIVVKFGGAVLNGADGLRRACGEIRLLPKPLLVVASAFADVTNRLEHIADSAVADPAHARECLADLLEHHQSIAREVLAPSAYASWQEAMEPHATRLAQVIDGLAIVRDLTPRTLDLIVHFGERMSSLLLGAALADGANAGTVTNISALDLVITDAGHRFARPDLELTRERVNDRLLPALATHDVVVTEGYIGRSTSGQATTMGRESSNYSATLLAELMGATSVTIYTGVQGVLTADPAFVPNARTLPGMSYDMATTLAELGAKVLHPRTVWPVRRAAIPLVISAIGGAHTVIGGETSQPERSPVCSIAILEGATLVTANTNAANSPVERFLAALAVQAPPVWHTRFRRRLQVVVAGRGVDVAHHAALLGEAVQVGTEEVSVVSLVREGGVADGDLARFFAAFAGERPRAVLGEVAGAIGVAVAPHRARDVVRALHHAFVQATEGNTEWHAAGG